MSLIARALAVMRADQGAPREAANAVRKPAGKPRGKPAPARAAAVEPPKLNADNVPLDPDVVADLCAKAGLDIFAPELIRAGAAARVVHERIASATAIRQAVALAAKASPDIDPNLADTFIRSGASLEHVRNAMFAMMIEAQSPEIYSIHGGGEPDRAAEAAASWDRAAEVAGTARDKRY